jgi:glycosyltransferase involved in cell wall biosynthesis
LKLVIQIPCFNEAEVLPLTLSHLPREVEGFDCVEWLVVDDGSRDGTSEVARRCGADHVVTLARNRGLARAFLAGLEAALSVGADVVVNTDADNQYDARDLPSLVAPILAGEADLVVGARPIGQIAHFSVAKRALQKLGSAVVRLVSGTRVPDAPSGFRAMTRDAAMRLNVFGNYTYTLETLIQAGQSGMAIACVPVRVNGETRPSRLVKSSAHYVLKSSATILRMFVVYKPMRFFALLSAIFACPGVILGLRYLWLDAHGQGHGHVHSLILAAMFVGVSMGLAMLGVVGDLLSVNRRLLEETRLRLRVPSGPAAPSGRSTTPTVD